MRYGTLRAPLSVRSGPCHSLEVRSSNSRSHALMCLDCRNYESVTALTPCAVSLSSRTTILDPISRFRLSAVRSDLLSSDQSSPRSTLTLSYGCNSLLDRSDKNCRSLYTLCTEKVFPKITNLTKQTYHDVRKNQNGDKKT